jgi:predicted acetyltransferase
MTYELRAVGKDDSTQVMHLMAEAFMRGRISPAPVQEEIEKSQSLTLGIFDGERLVCAATIHDLGVLWGDQTLRMGGVAGVACTADQRGRGHVARVIRESLVRMREAGQPLSGLYPFAFAFYRRYGWDWVGEKRRYTVPLSEVASSPEGEHVSLVQVEQVLPEIQECYRQFARRYRGMTDRKSVMPNWWNSLNDRDGRRTYVYVYRQSDASPVDGYMSFRFPEPGDTGEVGDFFANTPEAYKGLLSVLHYYGTQLKKAAWKAPDDDILSLHVMHHDLETVTEPLFMGRVVDVVRALESLSVPANVQGRLVLSVVDATCDWNVGRFVVDADGGKITVRRSSDEVGVAVDIQTLSQAFWGQPSLGILRRSGRVRVTDERQFSLLSEILPAAVCYLQDFF